MDATLENKLEIHDVRGFCVGLVSSGKPLQ